MRRSDLELDRFMAQATQQSDRRDSGAGTGEREQDDMPQMSFNDMTDR